MSCTVLRLTACCLHLQLLTLTPPQLAAAVGPIPMPAVSCSLSRGPCITCGAMTTRAVPLLECMEGPSGSAQAASMVTLEQAALHQRGLC